MSYMQLFFIALSLTVILEMLTYTGLVKLWKTKNTAQEVVFAGIFTSSCTLPYLWFVMPNFWQGNELILIGGPTILQLFS